MPFLPSATIDSTASEEFERNIVEHEIGHATFHRQRPAQRGAVGKFYGVDAGALQNQRQKVPDAGFFVDHIAERDGTGRQRRRCDDRFGGFRGRYGHFDHWTCIAVESLGVNAAPIGGANFVNYGFP